MPIGVIAIAVGRGYVLESRDPRAPSLDVRGAALLVAGLTALIGALTAVADGAAGAGVAAAAAATLLLVSFWRSQRRHPAPLIDTAILRTGHVAHGNGLLAINAGMLGATLFFTTLYLQVVLGYSPLAVAAAFAPLTVIVLVLSPRIGGRIGTWGSRRLLAIGSAVSAAGMLLLARLPDAGSYAFDVLPALALVAVGSAFSYAPTFVVGTSGVPADAQGLASGRRNASQEIGATVGITALATVAAHFATSDTFGGYRLGLLTAAVVTAASLILVARLPRRTFDGGPVSFGSSELVARNEAACV